MMFNVKFYAHLFKRDKNKFGICEQNRLANCIICINRFMMLG